MQWDAVAAPVPQTQRQKKRKRKSNSSSQCTHALSSSTPLTHRNRNTPFQRSNVAAVSVSALPPSEVSVLTVGSAVRREVGLWREERRGSRGVGEVEANWKSNSMRTPALDACHCPSFLCCCLLLLCEGRATASPQEQRARGECRGELEQSAEERGAVTRRAEWTHRTALRRPHRKPLQRH